MKEGLRIVQFTAENIKRLKLVTITPKGHVVPITGRNGQGKTSVLDAIWWALGGKENITSVPIRQGAETGSITLDLGDFIVERVFTTKKKCSKCNGKGTMEMKPRAEGITTETGPPPCVECAGSGFIAENGTEVVVRAPSAVEGKKGPKYDSPQTMLDALVGSLSFDPLEFARAEAPEQFNLLRKAVAVDFDFAAMLRLQDADFKERTRVNKLAKEQHGIANAINVPDGTPAKAIDVDGLQKQVYAVMNANADVAIAESQRTAARDKVNQRKEVYNRDIVRAKAMIERAEADLLALEKTLASVDEEMAILDALPPLAEKQDVKALEAELAAAKTTNLAVQRSLQREAAREAAHAYEDSSAGLKQLMDKREADKTAAIAAAKMPVAGLSLGDGIVTFDGIPFEQASDAMRLQVSIAIAMATNPKLRVIRIRDGSLLDEDSMKIIATMAQKGDYQFWMERVDTTGKVGIVLEDGAVIADNQVAG